MLEVQLDRATNKIYAPLKDDWLVATPEEIVRQEYVAILVNHYGYDLKQMGQEIKVNNSLRGQGKARADIVIWKNEDEKKTNKHAFIVVECKADNIKLQRTDYFQGANYAGWARAKFLVCGNLKERKVFRTDVETMPDEFLDEIADIPLAKDIDDEKKIKELLERKKTFTKKDFQNLLFKCHNIFRDNDSLAPDAAFDEISKILFMKILHERTRQISEPDIFSLKVFEDKERDYNTIVKESYAKDDPNYKKSYLDVVFEKTKKSYEKDKLFDPNDKIKIGEDSFKKVLKELEIYNLSDTDDDVKGIAFEEFLSKTFRGKGLGQFFTPRVVVKFITQILDPQEGELICDPCCGSGGFLIYSFEYIREQIEANIEKSKAAIKARLLEQLKDLEKLSEAEYQKRENKVNEEIERVFKLINVDLDNKTPKTRLHNLSFKSIYGTDKEARSARMAKMNMIMHGDGHGGVHQHEGLSDINGIREGIFDVILTNPPFGSRVADDIKDPNDPEKKLVDNYSVSKLSKLKEVMFTERSLKLLKPGGRMGIVLPEGFLNNSQLQNVREYFEGKAKILLITSIPQDVFVAAGATVKSSLIFLRKFTVAEAKLYQRITGEATFEINTKYAPAELEAREIVEKLEKEFKDEKDKAKKEALRSQVAEAKTELKKKLAAIDTKKREEIRAIVKERFDYQVPVAQVEKAGITATGGVTENELDAVVPEFTDYRVKENLWEAKTLNVSYRYDDGKLYRVIDGREELMSNV